MPQLKIGDWLVDSATNDICRNSELVHLEPKVADLLIALAQRADQVVSREELLAQVWSGVVVSDDVLTQGVIKLRKALGDTSKEPVYIRTIPKRGYRLIAPVTWLEADPDPNPPRLGQQLEAPSRTSSVHLIAPVTRLEAGPDTNPPHSGRPLEAPPRAASVHW